MAVIKCKMCGGELKVEDGCSVCTCEYCGTKQTVPTADNEKKMTLFTRASRLLRNCEFDKAAGVFEAIVADFPEEAEAYWGLILCKYGIEYVDDPATGKKVPTCHRSSFDSVEDDVNFEQACENADSVARRLYREEARQIEVLRKRILEVSGKEEPYDIFISYKELDEDGERTPDNNPSYSTNAGNITEDKIFLLSTSEVNMYFSTNESRKCAPSNFAIAQGIPTSKANKVDGKGTCWWWLRSPGKNSYCAAYVDFDGSVDYGREATSVSIAVRPAMWINLEP